jgi:D-alanyl-lipoteichoic acid acyltransferase DltB (MBOAT superfamily)
MSLLNILILIAAALAVRLLFPGKLRRWALLVSSIIAIYWLQPSLPVRQMDFWFPTATLGLVMASWGLTAEKGQLKAKRNWLAAALTLGTVVLLALLRFVSLKGILTASRPPQLLSVAVALLILSALTFLLVHFIKPARPALTVGVVVILAFFILLKNPALAQWTSAGLRSLMAQDPTLALPTDLGWLGFSYVAFRLIHTLIDRMNGRLKEMGLDEVLIYTIFFPAFMAGPLDRLQRFRKDLDKPQPLAADELRISGQRLATGLFRKFILADSLALVAITATNVAQVRTAGWLWLMLAAYSFQLYFDFAGYTDIVIGMGRLLGFTLPENFKHPYRQPNLTQFWNNWHMTLTQWFRGYFFNPITRALRRNKKLPAPLIIFITQMSTMLVIGLWHGITPNFIIWGLWHGLGLFIHNRWSSFAKPKVAALVEKRPALDKVFYLSGMAFNFVFVSLGWIWFALPTTDLALQTFGKLFGIA